MGSRIQTSVVSPARVLVTGAAGYIGRHACAALAEAGATVLSVSRSRGPSHDLLDPSTHGALLRLTRPTHLLHLAWYTEHGQFWDSPLNSAWQSASNALFERFYEAGGKRIVAAGTCAEYDWGRSGTIDLREDAPIKPATAYGKAKAQCGERLLDLAEGRGAAVWARIFFMFGRGEPRAKLVAAMIHSSLVGRPMQCGPGDLVRDFWDVRNVGAAFAALTLSDVDGAVNVASGEGVRLEELAAQVEALTQTSGLIRFGRRPGTSEPHRIVADTGRLAQEVGFCERWSLTAGLADYVRVAREVGL